MHFELLYFCSTLSRANKDEGREKIKTQDSYNVYTYVSSTKTSQAKRSQMVIISGGLVFHEFPNLVNLLRDTLVQWSVPNGPQRLF